MTRRMKFSECDFDTHECDFHSHECDFDSILIMTVMKILLSMIYPCKGGFSYDFDQECDDIARECDDDTLECDLDMQKCDFYTKSVISNTIVGLIHAECDLDKQECDIHTHELTILITSVMTIL
jgi:hypothetical protein